MNTINQELPKQQQSIIDQAKKLNDDDLKKLITVLTIELEQREKAAKDAALAEIQAIASKHGLHVMLEPSATTIKPGAKKGKLARVKYQDENGNTWGGRGLAPKWIKDLKAAGKNLDDYLTKEFKN